ncbi:MAG TPA: tetratricopeptide repeat protein [Ktedonobacteraceae bacterium]|jgi:tetratricopeptide (TPR) repeat protein|nr:tetratricopeptide repeat protein [Ktedonobacteraceae bacterium]
MTKKKQTMQRNNKSNTPAGAQKLLETLMLQINQQDYAKAIDNGEKLLNYLPKTSPLRADVLSLLGDAYAFTQDYPKSYKVTHELVQLRPNDPVAWYNHGLASFFTSRMGRAVRDFERAMQLDKTGNFKTKDIAKMPREARKMADAALKIRGKDFTLDQLIAQEDIYQQGLAYMEEKKWQEAEDAFRKSIAIADVLPQPWANIAGTLLMRERYDEAEIALRHALKIDPKYQLAKQNLKLLPELRLHGLPEPDRMVNYDPFRGATPSF